MVTVQNWVDAGVLVIIGENAGVTYTVVVDPYLYGAVFGKPSMTRESLDETTERVGQLFGVTTDQIRRETRMKDPRVLEVLKVRVEQNGSGTVLLYPNCLVAHEELEQARNTAQQQSA